jgi:hypothetical protein
MVSESELGIVALVIGVLLFFVGNQQVQEFQTITGQLARGLSEEQRQIYEVYRLMRVGGGILGVLGIVALGYDLASSSSGGAQTGKTSPPRTEDQRDGDTERPRPPTRSESATTTESHRRNVIVERDERRLIGAGSSRHFRLDVGQEAMFDYTVKVIDGPPLNVIVTEKQYLDEFLDIGDTRRIEEASAVGVKETTKQARIGPGEYVIILDNTGKVGTQTPEESAEVSISYSLIGK